LRLPSCMKGTVLEMSRNEISRNVEVFDLPQPSSVFVTP